MYGKIVAAMLAVLALGGTAHSQALSATDYVSRFYASSPAQPEPNYSSRVKALIRACERRNAECDYGIVMYMGQDMSGPAVNLSATLVRQKTNSAVVRVNYADLK